MPPIIHNTFILLIILLPPIVTLYNYPSVTLKTFQSFKSLKLASTSAEVVDYEPHLNTINANDDDKSKLLWFNVMISEAKRGKGG